MELSVLNIAGQETGRKIVLDDAIFGIQPNEHAIYLDVKQFLANNRQGTHKSKQRNEISGSTKKLKKQKGTGGAPRADSYSAISFFIIHGFWGNARGSFSSAEPWGFYCPLAP